MKARFGAVVLLLAAAAAYRTAAYEPHREAPSDSRLATADSRPLADRTD